MTTQNSTENQPIRPEEFMSELGIKKTKYYDLLDRLNIKADKDSEGKAYLTFEQAEKVRAYLSGNIQAAENDESANNSSLIKADNNNLVASTNNNSEEDIYIEPEEPTAQLDIERIIRQASELKARELATPNLIMRELANRMTEDDLPEDLKEKVAIAREVANPKWTPGQLADSILSQYRSQRSSS
jgi:hypothetical protein